jgi:hypothetical protein
MTFHSGEKNKLKDIIENIELKMIRPIGNHPLKLRHIKTKPKTSRDLIWDPIENKTFWYHETLVTSPHTRESEIDQLQR